MAVHSICWLAVSLTNRTFLELLQKAQIVVPELANIGDAVFEHGDPFWPHAEGETGVNFGIVAAVAQDVGMDHAAAENFQPAGVFAHLTALAVAEEAGYVHLGAGFGEGEVAGAEAGLPVGTKHAAGELSQGAFEVSKGDVLADSQPFYLGELDAAACSDLLVAVTHAGQNDAHGFGMVFAHGADLPGAGVRAQNDV